MASEPPSHLVDERVTESGEGRRSPGGGSSLPRTRVPWRAKMDVLRGAAVTWRTFQTGRLAPRADDQAAIAALHLRRPWLGEAFDAPASDTSALRPGQRDATTPSLTSAEKKRYGDRRCSRLNDGDADDFSCSEPDESTPRLISSRSLLGPRRTIEMKIHVARTRRQRTCRTRIRFIPARRDVAQGEDKK